MTNHIGMNQALSRIKDAVIQLYRDHKNVDLKVFREMAGNLVKHGSTSAPVEKKSLLSVLELFLKQYTKEKDSKTVAKYSALRDKLTAFDSQLCIENLDFNFYDQFKEFLFRYPNPNYLGQMLRLQDDASYTVHPVGQVRGAENIGLFDDTVYKYFTNLKTVLAWAEKRGFEISKSYKSWEIIKRKHPPISLTMAELEKLEHLEITTGAVLALLKKEPTKQNQRTAKRWVEGLTIARDYLALECRTGQRISDIKRFDQSQYQDFKWTFQPRKGNRLSTKKITVHFTGFTAPALFILSRNNFQMPKISEPKLNKNIKKLCQLAGIDSEVITYRWAQNKRIKISGPKYEFLSTHSGRKTFITLALQSMPPKLVKDLAGIDSYETLKHYEGESEDATIEKYLNEMQSKTLMKKVI
jgi:integrase